LPAKEFTRAHLPQAINISLVKLSEKLIASLDKRNATIVTFMTTSETLLPEPRRGSRVSASFVVPEFWGAGQTDSGFRPIRRRQF